MSKKIIYITIGLPGSGKSTWAKEYVAKHPNYIRINRDDLRNMRGNYHLPQQENLITKFEIELTNIALNNGYNVVNDNTNLNPKYLKQYKDFIINYWKDAVENITLEPIEVEFIVKDFTHISVEECIKNDLKRANQVGEKVIKDMHARYLTNLTTKTMENKLTQDDSLPHIIIVDIDGTVAERGNRSPFDWKRVKEDTPRKNIISIVETLGEVYPIVFMSGRDECCRSETNDWIIKHIDVKINTTKLYMRPSGDMRKDSIVKKELFETHIKDRYYVVGILDDRDQVVEMWRSLGLDVLQVNYGNF